MGKADLEAGTSKDEKREVQSLGKPEDRDSSGSMQGDEGGTGMLLSGSDI